jgi:hypothetical protein
MIVNQALARDSSRRTVTIFGKTVVISGKTIAILGMIVRSGVKTAATCVTTWRAAEPTRGEPF